MMWFRDSLSAIGLGAGLGMSIIAISLIYPQIPQGTVDEVRFPVILLMAALAVGPAIALGIAGYVVGWIGDKLLSLFIR